MVSSRPYTRYTNKIRQRMSTKRFFAHREEVADELRAEVKADTSAVLTPLQKEQLLCYIDRELAANRQFKPKRPSKKAREGYVTSFFQRCYQRVYRSCTTVGKTQNELHAMVEKDMQALCDDERGKLHALICKYF